MNELFGKAGIVPRQAQLWMASEVQAAIEANRFLLVQAPTGIGKTLAYLAPAIASRRRTIISVPTRQLQRQVLRDVERLGETAVLRLGMANFFSRSRINRILADLESERSSAGELIGQLRLARGWDGVIEEFVIEYGELLIDRSLICLRPGCPATDRTVYDAQKGAAEGASLIIQTHALTLLELRFGRHDAEVTIFDEAHSLPSMAASAVEARVTLAEVGLDQLAERLGNRQMVLLTGDLRAQIAAARDRLDDPDMRSELSRIIAPIKTLSQGAGIVAKPVPSLQRISIDPARFIGRALDGRSTIFVSATLDPKDQLRGALGLPKTSIPDPDIRMPKFGSMSITLADRQVPPPFKEEKVDEAFFDYAGAMVQAAPGRTLVLVASYDDVERIASRVPGLIRHVRGEPLGRFVEDFKTNGGKLITPVAWEGLDLPHFIDDVVIVRLPLAPQSELRQTTLEEMLLARGYDKSAAQHILRAQSRADTHRKMSQGIGRGIRAPDDQCRLWIADPRFPLPASMVRDARRMVSQGAAISFKDFASSIPERFRTGLRSSYDLASIFSMKDSKIKGTHQSVTVER